MGGVQKTFKDSFDTTFYIKATFQEGIILNPFDRENRLLA